MKTSYYILITLNLLLFGGCGLIIINSDNYVSLGSYARNQIEPFNGPKNGRSISEITAADVLSQTRTADLTRLIVFHNACVMYPPKCNEWIQAVNGKKTKINTFFIFNHYNFNFIKSFQTDCLPAAPAYILSHKKYGTNAHMKEKRFLKELSSNQKLNTYGSPLHIFLNSDGKPVFTETEGFKEDTTAKLNRIRTFMAQIP